MFLVLCSLFYPVNEIKADFSAVTKAFLLEHVVHGASQIFFFQFSTKIVDATMELDVEVMILHYMSYYAAK